LSSSLKSVGAVVTNVPAGDWASTDMPVAVPAGSGLGPVSAGGALVVAAAAGALVSAAAGAFVSSARKLARLQAARIAITYNVLFIIFSLVGFWSFPISDGLFSFFFSSNTNRLLDIG